MRVLLLHFQFGWILFLLVWLLWLELSVLCWIKVVKVDISILFLLSRGMLSEIPCWVWCQLWVCHIWPLLCYVLSIPTLLRVFIINACWVLSKGFSASIDMIMWFLSYILFMWWITFIDLWVLYQLCSPRINPTCSWCMIFLMSCWINLLIFYWGF